MRGSSTLNRSGAQSNFFRPTNRLFLDRALAVAFVYTPNLHKIRSTTEFDGALHGAFRACFHWRELAGVSRAASLSIMPGVATCLLIGTYDLAERVTMNAAAMAVAPLSSNTLDSRQKSLGFPTDFKQTARQRCGNLRDNA